MQEHGACLLSKLACPNISEAAFVSTICLNYDQQHAPTYDSLSCFVMFNLFVVPPCDPMTKPPAPPPKKNNNTTLTNTKHNPNTYQYTKLCSSAECPTLVGPALTRGLSPPTHGPRLPIFRLLSRLRWLLLLVHLWRRRWRPGTVWGALGESWGAVAGFSRQQRRFFSTAVRRVALPTWVI